MADDTKFAPSRNRAQLRDDVVWVATVATGGLRKSMAKTGVRQIKDFVNSMVAAGVLLEKSYGDVTGGTFAEHFQTCAAEAHCPTFGRFRSTTTELAPGPARP